MRLRAVAASAWGAAFVIACAPCATASTITFDFSTEFSGGQAPAGPAPWIVATFSDTSTAGQVQLTITTSGLTGAENISALYFNIDPALNVSKLVFSSLNGGSGTIAATSIGKKEDGFMADGDGKYDILLSYATGSGFMHGVTSTYDITDPGSSTFSAASFNFLSTPAGGHGPFDAAAHVQNTTGAGSGGSGWVAPAPVPLPAGGWLFMSGLGCLAALAHRRGRARLTPVSFLRFPRA